MVSDGYIFVLLYVRDKYETKREGVMEEMEITTAGLEMVRLLSIGGLACDEVICRMMKKILVLASLQPTRSVSGI